MLNPVSFSLDFEDGGNGQVKLNPVVSNAAPTFTRATTATTINREGLIVSVASGVARSYYDPTTRQYLGYLAEGGRTNLLLRSEELDNASWTKTDTTITADNTTAPDGSASADLLTEGSAGNASVAQAVTATADVNYTVTRFLKFGNTRWVFLSIFNGSNIVRGWFDLQNGVVGSASGGGTGAAVAIRIKAYSNGWYRCELVGSVGSGATAITSSTCSASADASTTRVANSTRYEWGSGFENNASFASSYIPTTTASVTRNADVLTYTTQWLNGVEGAILAEFVPQSLAATLGVLELNDGTANERMTLNTTTTPNASMAVVDGGGVQVNTAVTGSTPVVGALGRQTFAYRANDFAGVFNGGAVTTDTIGSLPTVTVLSVGPIVNGTIAPALAMRSVQYYPVRLPNDFLVTLSAGGDPFTKPGVGRRLRRYKKDETLEKAFPKLRDEEVEVKPKPKKEKPPVERSVTEPVQFAPDGAPIPSPTLEPVDFTLNKVDAPDDDAVSMAVTGKPASKLSFEGIQIPQSVGEIPFAPIDQRVLEALFRINEMMPRQAMRQPTRAELWSMAIDEILNDPETLEIEKAVWMKN